MACYSRDYTTVLQKNLPDKDIEIFWYNYKNFILNTYRNNFAGSSDILVITHELELFSGILNEHQKKEEWRSIISKIRNFQIYIALFLLASFKKIGSDYITINSSYILLIKFLKRWNNIEILEEYDKIPLKNLHSKTFETPELTEIIKIGVTISMICKNIHERKLKNFMDLVRAQYNISQYWWSKDSYEYNCDTGIIYLVGFMSKCVSVFLFDVDGKLSPNISILEYIAALYDFKKIWCEKNTDKIKKIYINGISTKKFCCKFSNLLKIDDFRIL
jgi:hypothetical protein